MRPWLGARVEWGRLQSAQTDGGGYVGALEAGNYRLRCGGGWPGGVADPSREIKAARWTGGVEQLELTQRQGF